MIPAEIRRWRVGHWMFFVGTQASLGSMRSFFRFLQAHEFVQAGLALQRAAMDLRFCAAAFRYAGDMTPESYEMIIVKDMPSKQPGLPDFSGIQFSHFRALNELLRRSRNIFRNLPMELREPHTKLMDAAITMVQEHINVCRRLTKGGRPSLLSAKNGSEELCHERLERFSRRFLSPLTTDSNEVE